MGDKSSIEWTASVGQDGRITPGATWNPSTGCNEVSPGCKNCYAKPLAIRLQKMGNPKYSKGFDFTIHPDALELPLKWKISRKIFVNSMSDLHHESMPKEFLDQVYDVMEKANWHIFQVLTKRPERMRKYLLARYPDGVPKHIWFGTSIEMALYLPRADFIRDIPGGVKFLSCEPLLGPLSNMNLQGIDWAIVGGESGINHREMKVEWVKEIRDQCLDQKVAFFFKQWGGTRPGGEALLDGREFHQFPDGK